MIPLLGCLIVTILTKQTGIMKKERVLIPMNQQKYLDLQKEIHDGKDIDKIGELFLAIVSMYRLTMDEVASISYYLVQITIKAEHNKA